MVPALWTRLCTRSVGWLTGSPLLRYAQVLPNLYVGEQYGLRGKQKLAELGVTGSINMRKEFDDAAHGLTFEHHLHLPTVDDTPPSLKDLTQGASFVDRVIKQGGKVYIHCAGGLGRAPTMAAAYLVTQGMDADEAYAFIRTTRPFINPRPAQRERLHEFSELYAQNADAVAT